MYFSVGVSLGLLTHRPNTTYAVVVSSAGAKTCELYTVSTEVKKIKELNN
jgi:hypothetical protein